MPASMMMPASGVAVNVTGSSSDMAATGPMPGSTPTSVPMNTPSEAVEQVDGLQRDAEAEREVVAAGPCA